MLIGHVFRADRWSTRCWINAVLFYCLLAIFLGTFEQRAPGGSLLPER